MNKWLNKALAAARETDTEPVAQDISKINSADSADSPLTALTTLSIPIGQTQKQAEAAPGAPAAPSPNQTPLPENWTAAVARLQQTDCPAHVDTDRWEQVVTDAQQLLVDWGQTLLASGWLIEDVFGRDSDDHQSVAWRVKGQRIWFVDSVAAVLRGTDGSTTWVYRRGNK